jgi:hypothetical protein
MRIANETMGELVEATLGGTEDEDLSLPTRRRMLYESVLGELHHDYFLAPVAC